MYMLNLNYKVRFYLIINNFITLKNEMESDVRIGGKGLKNLTYPYMGVGGIKNCKDHPCVINEWPLRCVIIPPGTGISLLLNTR